MPSAGFEMESLWRLQVVCTEMIAGARNLLSPMPPKRAYASRPHDLRCRYLDQPINGLIGIDAQ